MLGYFLKGSEFYLPTSANFTILCVVTLSVPLPRVIPNRPGESLEVTMNTSGCWGQRDSVRYIEHVQVVVSLQFLPRGSLRITLVSPSGTASHVLLPRSYDVKVRD